MRFHSEPTTQLAVVSTKFTNPSVMSKNIVMLRLPLALLVSVALATPYHNMLGLQQVSYRDFPLAGMAGWRLSSWFTYAARYCCSSSTLMLDWSEGVEFILNLSSWMCCNVIWNERGGCVVLTSQQSEYQ